MKLPATSILFFVVVATCLAQVAWWTYYQIDATGKLESALLDLAEGNAEGATTTLGSSDEAAGRRWMFITEGMVFVLLVLGGAILYWRASQREARTRRLQEQFLAGAAHALKTPITTLRLGLESLQAGTMPEQKRDHYLRAMLQEVGKLDHDVANLMAVAGSEGDPQHPAEGDLVEDLRAAIAYVEPQFEAAGIHLDIGRMENALVERDPLAIRTIFLNLLDNAAKYSDEGGRVTVELILDGPVARLSVSDTGCGLSSEDIEQIFEKFYRARATEHIGGAGLGLYLARELARAQGGDVTVSSKGAQTGSCFTVELPLRRPA
ncbi:MAG: HAMP domain-containing sensor histidine kinase [Planctomycetota bacterium]|nr:HAMP domain-containing sensor histidine kinase [Planctomycetota bacterium]